jgi:hypothetical protein
MCEKCAKIDILIERFRQVKRSISDQLTIDRAQNVIFELEGMKAALHSEQQP